jgi:hypothetical protein
MVISAISATSLYTSFGADPVIPPLPLVLFQGTLRQHYLLNDRNTFLHLTCVHVLTDDHLGTPLHGKLSLLFFCIST